VELLTHRLVTPLQIIQYLTVALEAAYNLYSALLA
jgi:hypothetical protein